MAVKKSEVIKSFIRLHKEKLTQILTTDKCYEDGFLQYREMLMESPAGGDFIPTESTRIIIVKLDPVLSEREGFVPAMFDSDMKFYDSLNHEMNPETIDFHIANDYYDEDDMEHVDDADDIVAVGINAHFQVTPIRSNDFKNDMVGLSPVYLSVGGPVYSAISDAIMNAFELLNIDPDTNTDVILEFVVPDIPYVYGGEPNRIAKDIVAMAESLAYKFLELRRTVRRTRFNIRTAVLWIRNVDTVANINAYVEKKAKKKRKKKSK